MDAENEQAIKKVQEIQTIQSMIDVSADRLEGLRTQCSTSAELTQQEIRTLEGKLVKHISQQLNIKAHLGEELLRGLRDVPNLSQWLRVVGLSPESIEAVCSRVPTLEALRQRSDHELGALLPAARDEEVRRLCRAMHRLQTYTEALFRGEGEAEYQLFWDSWERHERHARGSPRPRPRPRGSVPHDDHPTSLQCTPHHARGGESPTTPVGQRKQNSTLPPPAALTKSRSHESQLSVRPDGCEIGEPGPSRSPPASPREPDHVPPMARPPAYYNHQAGGAPRSPRTPPVGRCMAHDIAHRFTKTFNMIATCDYCDKQMLFGSGLKCKECKFKCHRDCESKVPPSCGLPPEFVAAFKDKFHKDEVQPAVSSPNHSGHPPHHSNSNHTQHSRVSENDELTASVRSDGSRGVSLSGSGSTDSSGAIRGDSLDHGKDGDSRWPRQNSLSIKEWDIPYDELKLFEIIGTGRFGTVYRGSWYGPVAVKLIHVHSLKNDYVPLDTFKHEVATFRKTRHTNLLLFMGACMKPPRLAIVTALCTGNTLYTHIHLRKDKITVNKSCLIAQQISQGMGYLHARGIIHKDLKTKNIFIENGKVVITDFGLFSVTKLCFGNNARGDSLGIPPGWLCYLAPELVRALRPHASLHLPFSKQTDVYAFGTVWYEILCNEFPFKGQPPEAIIWQVGKGVKQSLANMQISRDIKDILMQCWSYRASERPDFPHIFSMVVKLPQKKLARSPSHPVQLSRSADSVF
ncbi:kinase suppressor of Ras 2 [Amyelois transitella]|uniref:kinase suppressor of Ras 2 n=1 Tax=Amyelois transitella TaxID=680683 RepID=UPI00298F6554|nr:kinase suppressor of Ras 2 [Amyelois transitella]